jgi:hypothetical protein
MELVVVDNAHTFSPKQNVLQLNSIQVSDESIVIPLSLVVVVVLNTSRGKPGQNFVLALCSIE